MSLCRVLLFLPSLSLRPKLRQPLAHVHPLWLELIVLVATGGSSGTVIERDEPMQDVVTSALATNPTATSSAAEATAGTCTFFLRQN